jgi:hypothetical protein
MTYRLLKYRIIVVFLFLAVSNWALAQVVHSSQQLSADQLLQYYRSLKDPSQQGVLSNELHDGKCGLGIRAQVHSQWNAFSALQKIELKQLMVPPSTQKERVIGRFKIFYDTSGSPHVPALLDVNNQPLDSTAEAYVDSVGAIFNYVYSVEVDGLGYQSPPHEQGESYYRIFIQDMNYYLRRSYGLTDWDPSALNLNPSGYPPQYACFVLVDKDYKDYHTKGINALKVTAAHEFHHVIQVSSYGFRDNELFAYEITSTWMEDVVYTDVNDYYYYLSNYFDGFKIDQVALSFNYSDLNHGGYERCIWAHYLAKRFSPSIMRDVWTRMRTQTFLESTDATLVNIGSNLQTAFAEFTYWNYYTADRADTVKYYPEGNHYPRFQPLQNKRYTTGDVTVGGDVSPLSSSMYEFDLASSDTLTAMIANVDVNAAELGQTLTKRVDVTLSSQALISPYYELENGLKVKIVVADFLLWQGFFSQSSTLQYVLKRLSDIAPNPFRINNDQQLFLPVNEDEIGLSQVYLYSSSLSLVYTAEVNVTYQNKSMVIAVSGADLKSKLSSGVYFVIAKTKKKDYQWKVSVIR